jgi:hypothetical protein
MSRPRGEKHFKRSFVEVADEFRRDPKLGGSELQERGHDALDALCEEWRKFGVRFDPEG